MRVYVCTFSALDALRVLLLFALGAGEVLNVQSKNNRRRRRKKMAHKHFIIKLLIFLGESEAVSRMPQSIRCIYIASCRSRARLSSVDAKRKQGEKRDRVSGWLCIFFLSPDSGGRPGTLGHWFITYNFHSTTTTSPLPLKHSIAFQTFSSSSKWIKTTENQTAHRCNSTS